MLFGSASAPVLSCEMGRFGDLLFSIGVKRRLVIAVVVVQEHHRIFLELHRPWGQQMGEKTPDENHEWPWWSCLLYDVLLRFWPLLTFPPGNCVSGQIWIWTSASTIITLFSFCFLYCHQRGQTVSPCAMRPHSCLSPDIHTFDSDCQQGLWPGGIWAW